MRRKSLRQLILDKVARFSLSAPEVFIVVILAIFGAINVLIVPLGAGFDETSQISRVWEISALEFLPNHRLGTESAPFPMLLREVSYRNQLLVRAVESGFWSAYAGVPIDGDGYYYGPIKTLTGYTPVLLLPQSLIYRYLGVKFGGSFLTVYYATRLASLVSYVVLAWAAVRMVPFGKWTLAVLAAAPMALYQASTVSADSISNGIGILYLGAVLAISSRPPVGRRRLIALILLVALLFSAKVNLVALALLPLLLLRPSQFNVRGGYALLAVSTVVLFVVAVVGWGALAYPEVQFAMPEGSDPSGQLPGVVSAPLRYLWVVVTDLARNGWAYFNTWVGQYGYALWTVPSLTQVFFAIAVGASLLIPAQGAAPNRRTRIVLVIVATASYLAAATAFYVAHTPVGADEINGLHGRHLQTAGAVFFLAVVGLTSTSKSRWRSWAVAGSAGALIFFTAGAWLSYHVPCGSQFYQTGLCYQPYYKNWAPNENLTQPLSNAGEVKQQIVSECDRLAEVRVWFVAGEDRRGSTLLTLQSETGSVEIASKLIKNVELAESGWQYLEVNPISGSNRESYGLIVRALGDGPGPQLGLTFRPENPGMSLEIGGETNDHDLFFQYGCVAGLERLLR